MFEPVKEPMKCSPLLHLCCLLTNDVGVIWMQLMNSIHILGIVSIKSTALCNFLTGIYLQHSEAKSIELHLEELTTTSTFRFTYYVFSF